jgi:putative radical SAM enzyme (TIGR03279 family)
VFAVKDEKRIQDVEFESIAWEAGLEPGDYILSMNGKSIKDIFDYQFLMDSSKIRLRVKKQDGRFERIKIIKDKYEDIGLIFHDELMGNEKSCTNKCIFCFIDQLPPGMRTSVYYKDDDARLSMLHGNYVTLTNTTMSELKRLAKRNISPINISVHTVNPQLRIKMMTNRFAGDIMEKIAFLSKKNITMNCQVVLVRGYNDGEELEKTIKTLYEYHPAVNSLSIVPVGLTKHRKNLCELTPYDRETSTEVIDLIDGYHKEFREKSGKGFVYAADEFYIMAKRNMPLPEYYDGYPQIENGVGLVASFIDDIEKALLEEYVEINGRTVSIVTGTAALWVMKDIASRIEKKFKGIKINVFSVENRFFGESVTVAGLLTGNDIINALIGKDLGEELFFPTVMLKADEDVFLDNITPEYMADVLGIKVTQVYVSGTDLIDKIIGEATNE